MLISKTLIGNVHKGKKVKTQKEKERKKNTEWNNADLAIYWDSFLMHSFSCLCVCYTILNHGFIKCHQPVFKGTKDTS